VSATDPHPRPSLRRADFSLSAEQRALRDSFAALLARECPSERVRKAEPRGFDEPLWRTLLDMQIVAMAVPAENGGEGAGLLELAVVAEEIGRRLAPVPFIESVVAARLLARCDSPSSAWLDTALAGTCLLTAALHPALKGHAQLVPAGAVASAVVGRVGEDVVVARNEEPTSLALNLGCTPLGAWDLCAAPITDVVLSGPESDDVCALAGLEWRLLMAAAQVGIAQGALDLALTYARDRVAFDVPIATFQGVSHPLVDCHISILGARRLVWKAAWYADNEPGSEPHLIPMAFAHARRTANQAATVGIHTQGGLGVTVESDMQLYFRRAKGWANVIGDPIEDLHLIADALYGTQGN
jgi:alkylation response protein AidB-like acyl-CoA dehydrogenase